MQHRRLQYLARKGVVGEGNGHEIIQTRDYPSLQDEARGHFTGTMVLRIRVALSMVCGGSSTTLLMSNSVAGDWGWER